MQDAALMSSLLNADAPCGVQESVPPTPLQTGEPEWAPDLSSARIMIVDDEPINIKVARKYLQQAGYLNFITTSDSAEAVDLARAESPDVVLLDLMMPVSGLEILGRLRAEAKSSRVPVIVLTATEDMQLKHAAFEAGATDFLWKPVDSMDLVLRVRNSLAVKAYQDHLKNYAEELETEVRRRTAELEASRLEVIYCLGRAAEFRDNETGRHVIRVGRYSGVIAREMQLEGQTVSLIEHAAPLHDMGKIGIPDSVLLKPGRLEPDEFELMRKHTEYGHKIVATMDNDDWMTLASRSHPSAGATFMSRTQSPVLRMAAVIAATHHEKWDGTGYPLGLKGEEIPLEGRITAVADVFDALSSKRPYKEAIPVDECFAIMIAEREKQFDPRVLDAFLARREDIIRIKQELSDD